MKKYRFGLANSDRVIEIVAATFAEAKALFKCLDEIYQEEKDKIGSETYSYWKNAVGLDNKI
jgi:hypothetical protein